MNPANLIPAQFRALFYLAIVFAIFGAGWTAQGWRLNAKADREAAERKQEENAAILTRVKNNERKVEQDKLNSARIAKEHKNAMDKVRADIAAERLRRPKWCDEPAERTQADSADSGNGADPAGRLLPAAVESDIRRLIEETERAAATGRACQEFVRSNGMAPE
jgi:hypothetical protein